MLVQMAEKASMLASRPEEKRQGELREGSKAWDSSDDDCLEEAEAEFYDPKIDDKDERWAQRQRKGRQSDAILSCPACLTTLCLDCQRHERYPSQFRAMFVRNCRLVESEILRVPSQALSRKRSRRKSKGGREVAPPAEQEGPVEGGDCFRPVRCSECGTQVAVMDEDEVYHFYNAIPSYG